MKISSLIVVSLTIVCVLMLTMASLPDALCYPPAGSDYLPSTTGTIELEIFGPLGFNETIEVGGPTNVSRSSPYDPGDGRIKIDTEIVSMNLVGNSLYIGPITIIESPSKASTGAIQQHTGGIDFPADSFFDVFVEIQTTLGPPVRVLHNDDPVPMNATISSIPPWGVIYISPLVPIPLKDENNSIIGFIKHVSHKIGPMIGRTKDYIGQGCSQIIPVTIGNHYADTTTFTFSAYYDGLQPIGNQTITLNPLESGDAIIAWTEIAMWPKGTYNHTITINTYANNTLIYTSAFPITFKVTIVADIDGNGQVDMGDIVLSCDAFGSYRFPTHRRWNPNADIDPSPFGNGKIDMGDVVKVLDNFGQHYP